MATICRTLQKEVFDVMDEKLVGILNVTKTGKKKKKVGFLCASINSEQPAYATLHQVKETDKDTYKKKISWPLVELIVVDGKDDQQETPELDLTFDRVYKWTASSVSEKRTFIQILWMLCCRYLPKQKPHFVNVPAELTREEAIIAKGKSAVPTALAQVEVPDSGAFVALSEKEQQDLEQLMHHCDSAVSNAEAFAEQLSKELTMLDGANIHSMMASEAQVQALMQMIDSALTEADKIETRLNSYDEILAHVKDSIEKIADKNTVIERTNNNNRNLMEYLENILTRIDFPLQYDRFLTNPDFQPSNLKPVIEAAFALEAVLNNDIPQHMEHLQAVKQQKKRCEKLKSEFSRHLARHLNNLFIHHGNDPGESLNLHTEQLTLPRHSRIHTELMHYAPLMHWMRTLDRKSFTRLQQTYSSSISKLYERDIKIFFDEAKQRISGNKRLRGSGSSQDIVSMSVAGKLTSQLMQQAQTLGSKAVNTGSLLGVEKDQWSTEFWAQNTLLEGFKSNILTASVQAFQKLQDKLDMNERQKFDDIFEQVLSELEPVCLSEQQFCIEFFDLNAMEPGKTANEKKEVSGDSNSKIITKEVRTMLADIFVSLELQLTSFINTFNRMDSYCCLYIYVRLSQHVLSAEDARSFLSTTFGSCLVQAKRNYDNFMSLQVNSIMECKVARRKCGIVPFIVNFEEFALTAERVFGRSERRTDLDKWYSMIVNAIFENIPRIAEEHQRTPREVVEMENYHALHQLLSQLKLPGLETQRKEAKQKYQDALSAYVTHYFGRPLEKLNTFFDGVIAKVASGVKESEIGYQLAFSKQELRKVIKEYPGKEVRKGLDQLYKKVEKHLSDQGNLLQVVWRAMQGEFIQQYKNIDDLIHRCYPGAMVSLEFSIDDILNYFSDIAKSH